MYIYIFFYLSHTWGNDPICRICFKCVESTNCSCTYVIFINFLIPRLMPYKHCIYAHACAILSLFCLRKSQMMGISTAQGGTELAGHSTVSNWPQDPEISLKPQFGWKDLRGSDLELRSYVYLLGSHFCWVVWPFDPQSSRSIEWALPLLHLLSFVIAYISSIPVVGWSENVHLNCCHGKAGVLEDLGRAQVSQILCQLTE